VESLEERYCPDGSQITLNAVVQTGHQVQLSGVVSGDISAGVQVNFSGAVSASTTTDSSGNFSYTTSNASLGSVSAIGTDGFGHYTNTAQASIATAAPSLTLAIASVYRDQVTLQGQLTSIDASNRTISFSGVTIGTTTTNSNGAFSVTVTAWALGEIYASNTDTWGQASNSPYVTVTSAVPTFQSFVAEQGQGNLWIFSGQITDENAAGLTVYFGGLPSLAGRSTTVNSDGTFSLTCFLTQDDMNRTATADVADWFSQSATQAWCNVA
jgi:hypothetical protein